ncbi:disintegrin and metalloproteinase domain-containing protein 19 isoform X2 [Pristis pectinata]|nr:disintegrin and metalloproteinase domain-containing protein 19 isoform X2 [Pristis pectinata]
MVSRTEHQPIRWGRCGHGEDRGTDQGSMARLVQRFHRVRRDSWTTEKYVEMYIVADHAEFQSQDRDLRKTKDRILEIANYVDKFYRSTNIRIALIGLEVWTHGDQITMSGDPNVVLSAFLKWRQQLWVRAKHDNAQLITGIKFQGTTIGMAPLEGMCSIDTSGGVSMDHSDPAVGAAATMAHEIGHNLGLSHDGAWCCGQAPELGGCIMAAATGHPFPRVFSSCSLSDLRRYFRRGGGACLYNRPDMDRLYGARRCGNGYVEGQEECDCGEVQECVNPCCNANNCTLTRGAECAHGVCCSQCKLRSAGTVCRKAAGSCDLPEYCTGASAFCPFNVYRADGSSCENGHAYCYNGMCQSHRQQCEQLWGSGALPAPLTCFEAVNAAGNDYGNCGKDGEGGFLKCSSSDALCGKIQCLTAAKSPRERNTVSIDTTLHHNGRDVKCRGTYLYSAQEDRGDEPDPGLVKTGTKCGDGRVCLQQRCQNASFLDLTACEEKCHSHGVCNSNRNCHCDPHWAPPYCDKPGLGGSIDSGPVHRDSYTVLMVGLLLTFLLLLPALLTAGLCCYRHRGALSDRWAQRWGPLPCTHRAARPHLPETSAVAMSELQLEQKAPSRPAPSRPPSRPPALSRPLAPAPSRSLAPSRAPSRSPAPSRPPSRPPAPSWSPAPSRPPAPSRSPAPSRLPKPSAEGQQQPVSVVRPMLAANAREDAGKSQQGGALRHTGPQRPLPFRAGVSVNDPVSGHRTLTTAGVVSPSSALRHTPDISRRRVDNRR